MGKSKITFNFFVVVFGLLVGMWAKPAFSVPDFDPLAPHHHQCIRVVSDTYLAEFFEALDQDDVSLLAPYFAEDVVSEFGGDFPPETHVGIDATLENFDLFNQFTDNLQHEILSTTRSHEGWRISAMTITAITFEIAGAGFQFVGEQNVTLRFNESCLIDRFSALTFGEFGPIE